MGKPQVEICVKVLCDLMDVLHSTEVGPIHDDINEVMMNGLRTIIQTIIAMDRDDPSLGHLVAVMLSIFRQVSGHATESNEYCSGVSERGNGKRKTVAPVGFMRNKKSLEMRNY